MQQFRDDRANTFNPDNAMTAFNGTTLSYDADGNLTGDGTNTYSWDARDHLSALSGSADASFVYDALGRRARKVINNTTTQFLYDSLNPVQELDGSSPPSPTANLIPGLGVDEYFTRTDSGGAMSFLNDALGSAIALTDSSGSINTSYRYEPFGNDAITGSNTNPYQFTGRENDSDGLYYYRARYYSPTYQRFIAQDPMDFAAGDADLYAYVRNSPPDLTDPSGHFSAGDIPILVERGVGLAGEVLSGLGVAASVLLSPTELNSGEPDPSASPGGCNRDRNRSDCTKATPYHPSRAGIFSPHAFKSDWGGVPNSRFDICACKDGSIVIKPTGTCGQSTPEIPTDRRWK